MKNILISGATGFIGQRLVRALDTNIKVLARAKQLDYETVICNLESEVIPDNSLVIGSPGKIVRKVSMEEEKLITKNAIHYQENWKKYS